MRCLFDQECYGWLHEDKTFEPVTLPKEWGGLDPRGEQIERSRQRRFGCYVVEYGQDGGPSKEEQEDARQKFRKWFESRAPIQ